MPAGLADPGVADPIHRRAGDPEAGAPTTDSGLSAISAVSANSIWTVGIVGTKSLVEHFDGTKWSVIASANPSASAGVINDFDGVTALSDGTVVAVGATFNGKNLQPLILQN
jgi:photosystem II stability/assembly factor-like uncharacterized protein